MGNRVAKNRPSPKNEQNYIEAYKKINSQAMKKDNLDIAAVKTKNGETGHGLISEKINRSHDDKYHIVKNFISDKELKKYI